MPGREIRLVTGEIYHVLNRGVASQPIFRSWRDYKRCFETMLYYQNLQPPQRYSLFLTQAKKKREEILESLRKRGEFLVEIIVYCFMPNHFHFLLKQMVDGGIAKFLSNFSNSYTRYFNTLSQRAGPLLQGKFKAVRVETEEQLLHLSRYIHLNPYSSYVVKNIEDLVAYPHSSLAEYLVKSDDNGYYQKEIVLGHFKTKSEYQNFVFDQADYQRTLDEIKHLILEK